MAELSTIANHSRVPLRFACLIVIPVISAGDPVYLIVTLFATLNTNTGVAVGVGVGVGVGV